MGVILEFFNFNCILIHVDSMIFSKQLGSKSVVQVSRVGPLRTEQPGGPRYY
jgi:hypothetical protein